MSNTVTITGPSYSGPLNGGSLDPTPESGLGFKMVVRYRTDYQRGWDS